MAFFDPVETCRENKLARSWKIQLFAVRVIFHQSYMLSLGFLRDPKPVPKNPSSLKQNNLSN